MRPFAVEPPRCKCGCALDGHEEACPECGFNPRQAGLRVSMALLLVVVVSMTMLTIALPVWPGVPRALLGVAVASFGLSVATFLLALLATPSRFGAVFARF